MVWLRRKPADAAHLAAESHVKLDGEVSPGRATHSHELAGSDVQTGQGPATCQLGRQRWREARGTQHARRRGWIDAEPIAAIPAPQNWSVDRKGGRIKRDGRYLLEIAEVAVEAIEGEGGAVGTRCACSAAGRRTRHRPNLPVWKILPKTIPPVAQFARAIITLQADHPSCASRMRRWEVKLALLPQRSSREVISVVRWRRPNPPPQHLAHPHDQPCLVPRGRPRAVPVRLALGVGAESRRGRPEPLRQNRRARPHQAVQRRRPCPAHDHLCMRISSRTRAAKNLQTLVPHTQPSAPRKLGESEIRVPSVLALRSAGSLAKMSSHVIA